MPGPEELFGSVDKPPHYGDLEIEPFVIAVLNKMPFLEANAMKYLMRWRRKDGVRDLRKAIRCIEMVIKIHENPDMLESFRKACDEYKRSI